MKSETKTPINWILDYMRARIILWMMYGILIYLLKFSAPQIAEFIVEVTPMKSLSPESAYEHAFNYAIAIETCIFLLTAIGATTAAKWFIVVSVFTQLLFMHRWDDILMKSVWEDPLKATAGIRLLLGSIVISLMSPIGMWYLSEQIKKYLEQLSGAGEKATAAEEQLRAALEKRAADAEELVDALHMKLMKSEVKLAELEHPEFICTECGRGNFKTAAALNGHMRMHKSMEVPQ